MNKDIIAKVREFNRDVLNIKKDGVKPFNKDDKEASWLIVALNEEVNDEFIQGLERVNLIDQVDALLDTVYFAIGGMIRLGLTDEQIHACFDAVHNSNMLKDLGIKESRSGFGDTADAVKPEDWVAPETKMEKILNVRM